MKQEEADILTIVRVRRACHSLRHDTAHHNKTRGSHAGKQRQKIFCHCWLQEIHCQGRPSPSCDDVIPAACRPARPNIQAGWVGFGGHESREIGVLLVYVKYPGRPLNVHHV